MILEYLDLPLAFAMTPVAGALAVQRIWSRQRQKADIQQQEERAAAARREAMRAMRDAMLATERAQRSREEFLARMSHELRTPLNAVIGFSRVLESNRAGNQRPEDIQLLGRVRAGGEQLLRLVEDVLEQSRIARGILTLHPSEANVSAIAERVVASYASAASAKGLRLTGKLPASGESVALDGGKFEQALHHLVDNAIKFTGAGSVSVEIVNDPQTGRPTSLIVADTGIGIPSDRLEGIFEPFEQVDATPGRPYGGAGLGLPLARQLCCAMGCSLSVESRPGQGSRFIIRFPARDWQKTLG